jgi:uncharacterized Zn ribbon protein
MNKPQCVICEGEFAYNEKIIVYSGEMYCEGCYKDYEENMALAKSVEERFKFLEGKDIKFI